MVKYTGKAYSLPSGEVCADDEVCGGGGGYLKDSVQYLGSIQTILTTCEG